MCIAIPFLSCLIPILKLSVLIPFPYTTRSHTSLTPGTQYYYMFGDSVDGLMSDVYSFRALPQTGPDVTVRVVAYGGMKLLAST